MHRSLTSKNSTWLQRFLVAILVLGIFFRLINLDRKVYWFDEGFTSLRVGGYVIREVVQQTFNGNIIDVSEFRQYLSPNHNRNWLDTIESLAIEDPQHPPLYYLMLRQWMQWFGNSVAAIRSLSAVTSLLVFPCIYWLCRELFPLSPLTGWMAIALVAISPFHVLYAQEARQYSLWTVTILLSSAALLQAKRCYSRLNWGIYAIAIASALYTFLFSAFVAIAHGIYIFVSENSSRRWRWTNTVRAYLFATSIALAIFTPWIAIAIHNYGRLRDSTNWISAAKISACQLVFSWGNTVKLIFFNVTNLDFLILPLTLILVGYAAYFTYRFSERKVWLFLFTLFGGTALCLAIPDFITQGQRTLQARFLIPCYLSIQIAVAYLFTTKIASPHFPQWQRKMWLWIAIAVFTGGIFSSTKIAYSETAWNKGKNQNDLEIARIINQAARPLVVVSNYQSLYDCNATYLFSFSHFLNPNVKLLLVNQKNIEINADQFSNVFLYNPCGLTDFKSSFAREFLALIAQLKTEQNYIIEPINVEQSNVIWSLKSVQRTIEGAQPCAPYKCILPA
ncbi:glycosyltransferase family 39 protein [Chroococcidiopsis sp. CCNUC1]|uniref:glycosyltransferase family 39 protein n=1 Tax=Chroococcidiopsis sp. CCNUC1 TaxID=2653189 RepID=UPI0020218A19|nr:glycosyltransferase family 39 protein [Chroococcidiopsis sp. CCNUC1]URD51098.1 glycosyltransferase family 39 protein [Chroococcidiopsis sp. CCNUC1]